MTERVCCPRIMEDNCGIVVKDRIRKFPGAVGSQVAIAACKYWYISRSAQSHLGWAVGTPSFKFVKETMLLKKKFCQAAETECNRSLAR